MPNYNKSFNFRNGVQVDEDNFYINANGLVGIGTTIPRYTLDLHGDASISGLVTTRNLNVSGVATFNQISVGNSIRVDASSGIITAVKFYGDGSTLSNLPSSQWLDVDPTAAVVSIYSRGSVGVGTTNPSLPYIFTVGQNPDTVDPSIIPSGGVGFSSYGQIKATGIITAGQFSGPGGGITQINASNISSGTLDNSRLPSQINLPTGIATIRDVVVSSGATIAGVSTFTTHGLVSKSVSATNLNISGVATVSSTLEIATTGSLKFSGIAGIYIGSDAGTSGQFLISKGSGASGGVAWSNDISLTGIVTVGVLTAQNIWSSGFTTTASLKVTGDATIDTLSVREITSSIPYGTNSISRISSGIITTTTLRSSFSETGVTTSTSLNTTNLNASGIGTIGTLHSGNVRLNVETNKLSTVSGNLNLGAFTSTVNVTDNLKVDGSSILSGIATFTTGLLPNENLSAYIGSSSKAFSEAHIDDVRIGATASNQIDTRSGNLVLDSTAGTVNVKDTLDVDERLIVDGSSILSGIVTFSTGLLPNENISAYIGSSSKSFSEAHIDDVNIGVSLSNEINTKSGNLILNSTAGTVQVDDNLDVNFDLNVDRNVTITGITTLSNSLHPVDSSSVSLGSTTLRFTEAHIDDIRLGFSATNEIDTRSGNLILDSTGGTVEVDDNLDVNNALNVDGNVYLSGITTVATSLLPNQSGNISIGSSSKTFNAAYIDNIRIGVSGDNEIDTVSGNLTLDSTGGTVEVDDNLDVNFDLNVDRNVTITGITSVSGDITPNTSGGANLGSLTKAFGSAYIGNLTLGVNSNEITTKSGNLTLKSFSGSVILENNLSINNQLYVTGLSTFANTIRANSGILPSSDLGSYIGSATTTFANAHIGNINIANAENNTISTKSGDLKLNSTTNIVRVSNTNKLIVDGITELTGIASVTAGIIPSTDKSGSLGSSNYAFANAYINNIRIAAATTSTIDTVSGDLILQSNSNYVQVNDNLVVGQGLTVTNNINAGPLFVNSSTNRIGVGTLSPESKFDVVSADDNVSVLIKTSSATNFPTLTLSSGSNSANIQFNEQQDRTLKIKNQTPGPIEYQLHSGAAGINTGNHTWKYKDTDLMALTYGGKLGIGRTNPLETFEVVGTSTVTSNAFVGGNLKVGGDVTINGDLNVSFANKNFNVGILTASKLFSISSITAAEDFYANRTLYVDDIREKTANNKIQFNNSSRFNYNADHYADVTINNGYGLDVFNSGTIEVRSGSSGVGTASTITSEFIASKLFIGGDFEGKYLNSNLGQVGILTVTTLNVTGVSTVSFGSIEASKLTFPNASASILVGVPRVEQSPGAQGTFVGIATAQRYPGVSFFVDGPSLFNNIVVGVNTSSEIGQEIVNSDTTGLCVLKKDVYIENSNINITQGGNISIGNSELNVMNSIHNILDPYGKTLIGLGTDVPRAVVDLSKSGIGLTFGYPSTLRFMLPPSITTTQRVGLSTVEGAFIFNNQTKKHQMYDGTAWHDMY